MACTSNKRITFYRKSLIDLDKPNVTITITDPVATNTGQASVDFMRNRNNNSSWATSASDDTANTEILVEMGDLLDITDIMIIKHTFKDYIVEYLDPNTTLFVTYENIVGATLDTAVLTKTNAITTRTIKITVFNTQIADDDKVMRQLVITERFWGGEFESSPQIKKPMSSKNKRINKLLSGKVNVVEGRGAYSVTLEVKLNEDKDLTIIEAIYENREGVLMLLSGGNEDQFITRRVGYRNEDIVLVRPVDEYINPYDIGVYQNRIKIKMKLNEAVF